MGYFVVTSSSSTLPAVAFPQEGFLTHPHGFDHVTTWGWTFAVGRLFCTPKYNAIVPARA